MAQTGPLPPYGEAIQQAVASGDVARMRQVAKDAEAFIAQWGNIPAALEALRLEIAKAEYKGRGGTGAADSGSGTGGSSSSGGTGGTRKTLPPGRSGTGGSSTGRSSSGRSRSAKPKG